MIGNRTRRLTAVTGRPRANRNQYAGGPAFFTVIAAVMVLLLAAGCSQGNGSKVGGAQSGPNANESKADGADAETEGGGALDRAGEAASILLRAQRATSAVNAFNLEMSLDQTLVTGKETSRLEMTNTGHVQLKPLAMKQTTKTDLDGDASTIVTYLTPGGYYMHDLTNKEWTQMDPSEIPKIKETLSGFQTAPSSELGKIAAYADLFSVRETGGRQTLVYAGGEGDSAAKALTMELLRSTLGTDQMEQRTKDSIKVTSFSYTLIFDRASGYPLQLKAEGDLTVEYEPGTSSKLHQTLTLTYSRWNEKAVITVPKEGKEAPSVIPPSPEMLEELTEGL